MRTDTDSRAFLILLVVLSMLGPLTLNILVPSLPGMVKSLNATKESVQLTLSLYLLGIAVSQLVLGPMADRFGRRPVLLGALALYIITSLAAFAAPNVEFLILARILQSFGAAAGLTLGRTMIRDLYERDHAASMIGYVTMAMVVAPMLAPSIGAFIDTHLSWRAILLFCAAMGAISLIIATPTLPETRPASLIAATSREVVERSLHLLRLGRFMAYWGTSTFCSGMFFAFLGAAPYLMIDVMGYDKNIYGLWFASLSIAYMIGNFMSGRLAQRLGVDQLIAWGNWLGMIGAIIMLLFAASGILSPLSLFLPTMITSLSNGLVLPNSIAAAIGVDAKAAGAASGLMGFGQMGVGAAATFLGAYFVSASPMPLALMMAGFALLSLLSGSLSRQSA